MANPVVYFEIGGRGAEGLREFYSELFGWKIDEVGAASAAGSPYCFIQGEEGGIPGGLIQTNENMPPNYVMFYVQADNLQATLDKVVCLGGQAVVPPTDIPGGRGQIAVFMDPDNNVIGLHKWTEDASDQD